MPRKHPLQLETMSPGDIINHARYSPPDTTELIQAVEGAAATATNLEDNTLDDFARPPELQQQQQQQATVAPPAPANARAVAVLAPREVAGVTASTEVSCCEL